MVTVLGFNLLGDGLRAVLDPRLRGRHRNGIKEGKINRIMTLRDTWNRIRKELLQSLSKFDSKKLVLSKKEADNDSDSLSRTHYY